MATPMEHLEETHELRLLDENGTVSDQTGLCKLCLKSQAAYTCPRCNLSYCSLVCYKSEKHADCSESFYKNNFIQALKETKGSSEDKKAVLEMLARLDDEEERTDDSDDDENNDADKTESLHKRLSGVDLDEEPDKVWERLTPQERLEFEEVLRAGTLGSMLEQWIPWWTEYDRELINDIGESAPKQKGKQVATTDLPKILESVPSLSKMTKAQPSPLIVFDMINLLYGYAFTVRLYNGSHMDLPLHAIQTIFEVCLGISKSAGYDSIEEAIQSPLHIITQLKSVPSERKYLVSLVQDVVKLMLGRSKSTPTLYIESLLSDLHELVVRAQVIFRQKDSETKRLDRETKASMMRMFLAERKIEFYLAWIREYPRAVKDSALEVHLLHRSMERELERHDQVKAEVEKNLTALRPRQTKLVEEIS